VNSQGRFLETSDGGVVASNVAYEWAQSLEALPFSALVTRVKQAVPAVESGQVKPAPPARDPRM
jgi:hypothetical protein